MRQRAIEEVLSYGEIAKFFGVIAFAANCFALRLGSGLQFVTALPCFPAMLIVLVFKIYRAVIAIAIVEYLGFGRKAERGSFWHNNKALLWTCW